MQNDKRFHNATLQAEHHPSDVLKVQDSLDLREFWKTLVRRKKLLASLIGGTVALTIILTFMSQPVYRATATLQIERESTKVIDVEFFNNGDIRDTRDFYQTQFELIRSRALAAQVIKDLNLKDQFASPSAIVRIKQWLGLDSSNNQERELENKILENLSVEPIMNSRLVAVHYDGSTPEQAAQIANAVVKAFEKRNIERRVTDTQEAKQYLTKSVEEAKAKLEDSEQRLNQYARDHEIFQIDDAEATTTSSFALKNLSEELVQAQKQRIEKESKYELLSDKNRKLADRIGVLEDNAAYLQALSQRLDKLKAQYDKQPSASLRTQIKNLETQIDVEVSTKLASLKGEYESAKKKEGLLHEGIAKAKSEAMQEQDKAIAYGTLKREVTTNQQLYQNLLQRLKEVSIAGGVGANNVTVIDKAEIPLKKFKPNLATNLAFGALLGLLMGVAAVFLREFLDDTVKDINTLERETRLPVLGIVPAVLNNTPSQMAQLTIKSPKSNVAESFRSLRTALRFLLKDENKGIIFVTSACAGEGKTTTVVNLASAYASAGNKVLVIDADLRNPALHKTLAMKPTYGLADYLLGKIEATDLVQATSIPNLFIIAAGTSPEDPAELLSSERMHSLLDLAREHYDQIILDGPPVVGLADALVLSSAANVTLMAVRSESTRTGAVLNALKRLRQSQANVAGILLNRVDMSKGSGYGYDYNDYYYKHRTTDAKTTHSKTVTSTLRSLKLM